LAGAEVLRQFEKAIMLQILDTHWKEHLASMDHLRQGIHLRGFAQKNPKQEYKREAFEMFGRMLQEIMREVITVLSKVEVKPQDDVSSVPDTQVDTSEMTFEHEDPTSALAGEQAGGPQQPEEQQPSGGGTYVREGKKVGRNEPCPCGSGKKYKQCHGKIA
ncbi:MAG: SEC-C metal-binding domain-containing protein, partial [Pseudomonadota bacterium]